MAIPFIKKGRGHGFRIDKHNESRKALVSTRSSAPLAEAPKIGCNKSPSSKRAGGVVEQRAHVPRLVSIKPLIGLSGQGLSVACLSDLFTNFLKAYLLG